MEVNNEKTNVKKEINTRSRNLLIKSLITGGVLVKEKMASATSKQKDEVYKIFYESLQDAIATYGFVLQGTHPNHEKYTVIEHASVARNPLVIFLMARVASVPLAQESGRDAQKIILSLKHFVENEDRFFGEYGALVIHDGKLALKTTKEKRVTMWYQIIGIK